MAANGVNYSGSLPEKRFGKVSMLNSDGSIITTGTIVPVRQSTECFGKTRTVVVLKIKSNDDEKEYDQATWISNCVRFPPAPPPTPRPVRSMRRSPECEWF
jgi:hypothetical protein